MEKKSNENKADSSFIDKLQMIEDLKGETIKIFDLLRIFGRSSFHIIIMILVAPSSLPLPAIPGITQIFALSVFFILIQLLFNSQSIWLPKKFGYKELSVNFLKKISSKLLHFNLKIKFFIKKRFLFLFKRSLISIIYLFLMVLSICIAIPIPFSNTIPSISILVICFAILERDGLLMIMGVVIGFVGFLIVLLIYIYGAQFLVNLF